MHRRACLALLPIAFVAAQVSAQTLLLSNGDVVTGEVLERTSEVIVLRHPLLGEIRLDPNEVVELPARSPEAAPAEEATPAATDGPIIVTTPTPTAPLPQDVEPAEKVRPGLFGTGFLRGWTRSLSIGLTGSEGNSEDMELNLGFAGGYEDDRDRWQVQLAYLLGYDEHERDDNEFYASVQKDWLVPDSRWYYFVQGRYDYDEFEDWDHRVSAGAGVGYAFIDQEKLDLRGKAGLGASREWGSDNDDIVPEGILGLEFAWRPADNQEISASTTFYPALDDFFEFRNISSAQWKIAIDRAYGLSLKLGVDNEYDSQVGEDTKHYDLTYYAALVYDF